MGRLPRQSYPEPGVWAPASHRPTVVVHTYNLDMFREVETGKSDAQCHPQLSSESQASLGYMGPCLRTTAMTN